ncbi:MAG TPA: PPOX class F420-dependent oxidoreductase [Acidimicrobiales bacterium]
MDLDTALAFARPRSQGVLTTLRADGRPQLSNILYAFDGDEARISITASRAKTKNLRRDPRGSLYVPGESFWAFVVLDGPVTLSPVAAEVDDDTVEQLVTLYRDLRGEDHPDWDEYRRSMVADGRLVARLAATSAYGLVTS